MPFTDTMPSASGRNSRSSNVSGMTGASRSIRSGPPPAQQSNDTLSSGVLSMLKTSTDTGGIGVLPLNSNRMPAMPRPAHARRTHTSRTSDSSQQPFYHRHHYATSQTSRVSDGMPFHRRGSIESMQSMPPALPGFGSSRVPLQVPPPTFDSRSYSLTSAPAAQPIPRHRSATSLKSAGHEPRMGHNLHLGPPPTMPENRPPYVYPTRLKRPGYRSPSPALSELSAQTLPAAPPPAARRHPPPVAMNMPRPAPQTFNSDYAADYGQDDRQFYGRPPPRAMATGPNVPYSHGPRQPGMRAPPRHGMPRMPAMASAAPPVQSYGPVHPQYAAAGYPVYPAAATYGHGDYAAYYGPPPEAVPPMGHAMFHHAARLARNLPVRTETPMTGTSPASSDPPSSGTAPSSPDPPTPQDQTTIHVAVDPLFIDPALTDLPDSSSEPVLPGTKYFQYAEGHEPSVDMVDHAVPHPSVPPTGFVQRVRAMLESRAAVEEVALQQGERERAVPQRDRPIDIGLLIGAPESDPIHELAAEQSLKRFTLVEEFDAPAELPASPVRIAELSNSPEIPRHRITRELVKAELGPSSTANSSQLEPAETEIEIQVDIGPNDQSPTQMSTEPDTIAPEVPPKTTQHKQQNKSVAESAVTVSEAVVISGIDYALRFSRPVDTTISSDETQSKDHFALDADTITLQHQRSAEKLSDVLRINEQPPSKDDATSTSISVAKVSPLKQGDVVVRTSVVSPIGVQSLGNDTSLGIENDTRTIDISDMNASDLTADSQDATIPPPTPRTPKTYSKSVQIPNGSMTTSDTPGSNRHSLPPDLSTIGDITSNTTSEMVTDVAVRFSLPTTTITIGKPQIVTIPPSSSPEKAESPPRITHQSLHPRVAKRNSVTFADQVVAPLNIRKAEQHRRNNPSLENVGNRGKSIIRKASPSIPERPETAYNGRETTAENRLPPNTLNGRFGSTRLPGLKEESIEDMSVSEQSKRVSELQPDFKFPLPARIAAVKAMQERRLHESAEKAKARRSRGQKQMLAEIRDLPSLNFSSIDLIEKLNQALEVRPTKSLEVVRRSDPRIIHCPSPQRPQSTEPLRDRYMSFFSKPEDFTDFFDEEDEEGQESQTSLLADPDVPVVQVQDPTEPDPSVTPESRPLSPQDFLNVASEINRLSIPSVSGLSDRLTELLPCLKSLHLDSVLATEEDVENTIDEIQHLGSHSGRPDTVLSNRTSAGFRTLAERAEEIVQRGTHDSLVPVRRLTDGQREVSADKVSALNSTDGRQSCLSGSISAPSNLGKEPARPASAHTASKSPTTEEEVLALLPPESNPIARGAKRSLMLSGTSTRPWNSDENYPWSASNLTIDLTVPSEAHTRDSIVNDTIRRTKSLELTHNGEPTATSLGVDIGSIRTNLDSSASITTEQATGISPHHSRKPSKRSIIGSISKRIGLTHLRHTVATSGHDSSPRGSPAVRSDESLEHKPGDRYPTTALTPPAGYMIDEVRSYFSEDSTSERLNSAPFRKRLTVFNKGKGKTVRINSVARGQSFEGRTGHTGYDAGAMNIERLDSPHTYEGVGMGKAEFHFKRFGAKLRNFFSRGGDLIRSLSARSKARDDWLADSVYSNA